jgi:hypothetical protein
VAKHKLERARRNGVRIRVRSNNCVWREEEKKSERNKHIYTQADTQTH